MTTKHRIILGFLLMICVTAGLAVIGVRALGTASDNFNSYDRMARLNVLISDAATEVQIASTSIRDLFNEGRQEFATQTVAALDKSLELLTRARSFMRQEKNITNAATAIAALEEYKKLTIQAGEGILLVRGAYTTKFQPAVETMAAEMGDIATVALRVDNKEALHALTQLWQAISLARRDVATYIETLNEDTSLAATRSIASMGTLLSDMAQVMTSGAAKADMARLSKAHTALSMTINEIVRVGHEAESILNRMRAINQSLIKTVATINATVDGDMLITSALIVNGNTEARTTMTVMSAIGMVVGALIALIIISTLVRVLRAMARYANDVARGDFSQPPHVREKGEIGGMLAALNEIPTIINNAVTSCDSVARSISSGKFRERLDEALFSGRFRDMAQAVNSLSIAFTQVVDNLPVGIMTASKDRNINYLNKQLQGIFDNREHVGEPCGTCFNSSACGSDKACPGLQTLLDKAPVFCEVTLSPNGAEMNMTVSTSPLCDREGNILGYMETLSDVTNIRSAESTMRQVAEEAAEISNRVAAASQELATQVEQISRGADMQRERVESTASAMTEMNATVLEVARNAAEAAGQSENTRSKAESGAKLVGNVVSSINTVNTVAGKLQTNMNELGKQAESIGEVLNVISDIADQTNLLALNAAIEAARAGEAGRGFAVVADEVRKLAEKTMAATQEVGQRIASMQSATRTNVTEVETAVKNVTDATQLANSSGQALEEIVAFAARTSTFVASIATAAEQQSATSEEISGAVTAINTIIGETSDGMTQSSHAVRDLARMAEQLRTVMSRIEK